MFDTAGPQVFFSETRERAVAEVERANEIVARYPTTISMRHLREMDAAWRAARGLPLLPEPEGRRVIIPAPPGPALPAPAPDRPPGGEEPRPAASDTVQPAVAREAGDVSAFLAAAAEAGAHEALRQRVEQAEADLQRTAALADALPRASRAADPALARFRAALQGLYGEHAQAAEDGFRRAVLDRGLEHAVASLRDDPRSLVPAPRPRLLPGGVHARAAAAGQAEACGAVLRHLDSTLLAACEHAGVAPPASFADAAETRRTVLGRLHDLVPAQRAVAEEAAEDFRRLDPQLTSPDALRTRWSLLSPVEQEAVRTSLPEVDALLAPAPRGAPSRDL